MNIAALIMAGGRSTRFNFEEIGVSHREKPLLRINKMPIIERIIKELNKVDSIERIIVAVSPHTLQTQAFLKTLEYNFEVISTPGDGYHEDLKFIVKKLNLRKIITITADIPLITGNFIEKVLNQYYNSKKPALSVMSPKELFIEAGFITPTMEDHVEDNELIPIGINVIDGTLIDLPFIDQAICLNMEKDFIYNINTVEDFLKLKDILSERT